MISSLFSDKKFLLLVDISPMKKSSVSPIFTLISKVRPIVFSLKSLNFNLHLSSSFSEILFSSPMMMTLHLQCSEK